MKKTLRQHSEEYALKWVWTDARSSNKQRLLATMELSWLDGYHQGYHAAKRKQSDRKAE